MPTKDRLPDLKNARERLRRDSFPEEEQSITETINFDYQLLVSSESIEDFLHEASVLRKNIEWIRDSVNKLKRLHSSMLSAPVVKDNDRKDAEDLTESIQQTAKRVQKRLEEFDKEVLRETNENPTSAQLRITETQRTTLTRDFIEVMRLFNNSQVEYRERSKKRFQRQLEIAGRRSTTNQELEEMFERVNPVIFTREIKFDDTAHAKRVKAEIEARHNDIVKLEESIVKLRDMFMDMALLVNAQGDVINCIEENVKKSVDYCEKASKSTRKAATYKNKYRKKVFIITIITITAVGLLIGIICAFVTKKKN